MSGGCGAGADQDRSPDADGDADSLRQLAPKLARMAGCALRHGSYDGLHLGIAASVIADNAAQAPIGHRQIRRRDRWHLPVCRSAVLIR